MTPQMEQRGACESQGNHMEGKRIYSLWRLLPDDVLADVLRRAAPRDLAVSRCVCRAWRALVDDRRLLRADLLPRSLAGLFINYCELPYLFFRPSAVDLADYHLPCTYVRDHCNGLLLTYSGVLNPATGGWTPLPLPPPPPRVAGMTKRFPREEHLAFDPTLSPHYEVLLVPVIPVWFVGRSSSSSYGTSELEEYTSDSEWPPSPCHMSVFSSRTGSWDQRSFTRQNEAAGTVADVVALDYRLMQERYAVCWRGALYVHCQMDFIMRILLSDDTYRVIKPPRDVLTVSKYNKGSHLGKSQNGVYFAVLLDDCRLYVWILLDESGGGQPKWIPKHDTCRGLVMPSLNCIQQACYGPWILDDDADEDEQACGWNSDDETSIVHTDEDNDGNHQYMNVGILGFHPYKEIVFLHHSWSRGLAYHLNGSKLEDLGNLCPKDDLDTDVRILIRRTFPYTPCFTVGEFSEKLEFLDDG